MVERLPKGQADRRTLLQARKEHLYSKLVNGNDFDYAVPPSTPGVKDGLHRRGVELTAYVEPRPVIYMTIPDKSGSGPDGFGQVRYMGRAFPQTELPFAPLEEGLDDFLVRILELADAAEEYAADPEEP